MQNDYRILFEILKEKTGDLEISWKKTINQVKEANLQKTNSKANVIIPESKISHNEFGRPSFGRRINPTQLKSESIVSESNFQPNPFKASLISNEIEANNFFPKMNINRSFGRNAGENVWKKLSEPIIAKVGDNSLNYSKDTMEYLVYFKQRISTDQQNILKKLSSAYSQIVFDEVSADFSSFSEKFGIILRILVVGHELFSLNIYREIIIENFLLKPLPKAPCINGESLNILEDPMEMFQFAVFWIQGVRERLVQLLPDSLRCFEKNLLLDSIDPHLALYFKHNFKKEDFSQSNFTVNSASKSSLALHSLLPIAYSNQRDSKHFFRDPTSYTNQQKIRDLFINLMRHFSTHQLDFFHPNFHRNFSSRVNELIIKVNTENYAWFADLYIQEYEQAADVRFDRFEERMASRKVNSENNSTSFSLDQIFFMFLQYADSYKLIRAVEKKIIAMVSISLDQANNHHKRALWPECIRKLRSIIKLLAFCKYKMSELSGLEDNHIGSITVEEEDVIIYSWTQAAILNRQLLTVLPLIYEYFVFIGENSIKSRCSNTVKLLLRYYQVKFELRKTKLSDSLSTLGIRARLFLKLCLEDIFKETLNSEFYAECILSMNNLNQDLDLIPNLTKDEERISKSRNVENYEILTRALDEDDSLPASISSVYRSISSQVRNIYLQLNSICMSFNLNNINGGSDGLNNLTIVTNPNNINPLQNSESTLRKIRPITQVSAGDLKQRKIQKQLRQWFWWRYGGQKDLIDALNSYILEQLIYPQFPMVSDRRQSTEISKQMYHELICKILPDLLPNFWKDHPEMIEMIVGLSLEVAFNSIRNHFSE